MHNPEKLLPVIFVQTYAGSWETYGKPTNIFRSRDSQVIDTPTGLEVTIGPIVWSRLGRNIAK